MGVVFCQAWSESQLTVLMGYFRLFQQMLDAIRHIMENIEDSTLVPMHCACNTIQLLRRF